MLRSAFPHNAKTEPEQAYANIRARTMDVAPDALGISIVQIWTEPSSRIPEATATPSKRKAVQVTGAGASKRRALG